MFSPSANAIDPADDFRLPLDVTPTHYDITIKTDLDALVFSGSVKIEYVQPGEESKSQMLITYIVWISIMNLQRLSSMQWIWKSGMHQFIQTF